MEPYANRAVKKYTDVCVAPLEANSKGHRLLTACKQKVAVQAEFLGVEPEFRLNERITLTLCLLLAYRLLGSI